MSACTQAGHRVGLGDICSGGAGNLVDEGFKELSISALKLVDLRGVLLGLG